MQQLFKKPAKTYATYAFALRAADKIIGDRDIRVVIGGTSDGRFYPIALGSDAFDAGLHFQMCCA
jgi:hypothetical protein